MTGSGTRQHSPVWPVVVLAVTSFLVWSWANRNGGAQYVLPAVPVASATFLLVQLALPSLRWTQSRVLGPGNIAMLLFMLQLVIIPAVMVLNGPAFGSLRVIPPERYINAGLLLQALAYASYAGGYAIRRSSLRRARLLPSSSGTVPVAAGYLGVGILGLVLAFPTVADLVAYFSGQGDVLPEPGSATLAAAAGTFLRPFLSFGLVIVWAVLAIRRRHRPRVSVAELGLAALAIAAAATFGYNRAAVVVPLVALVTAYAMSVRQVSMVRASVVLVAIAALSFQFGQYRGEYMATQGARLTPNEAGIGGREDSLTETLQVYGNGAQFWSVVIQDVDRFGTRDGETLLGSVLFPVPIVGKPFRAESGPTIYNELVYGRPDIADQILPFGAELYWNLGVPGVVAGFMLLGLLIRRFDDLLDGAEDPLAAYVWAYSGVWAALLIINSLSILAQIAVYFFAPIVLIVLLARMRADDARRPEEVRT